MTNNQQKTAKKPKNQNYTINGLSKRYIKYCGLRKCSRLGGYKKRLLSNFQNSFIFAVRDVFVVPLEYV